ncbi:MAG: FecCD family ABC transporter permease [Oceanococcus sp.]
MPQPAMSSELPTAPRGHLRWVDSGPFIIPILLLLTVAAFCWNLLTGPFDLRWAELLALLQDPSAYSGDSSSVVVFLQLRLPRSVLTLLVGAALAVSGAVMQGLFRNALADPSIIGVTSGASLGASLAIAFGGGGVAATALSGLSVITLGAFIGGLLASYLVFGLARRAGGSAVSTMLLLGIAVTAMAGAVSSGLEYFVDDTMLRRMSLWRMGGLDGANWSRVLLGLALLLPFSLLLLPKATALNILLLGDSEARHLGIAVQRLQRQLIVWVALLVATSVAVAGVIGFVGLVVPHMLRLLLGPDHRRLLPASLLGGACLLLVADALARTLLSPSEIPTGVVTAIIGAPVFVWILRRSPHLAAP